MSNLIRWLNLPGYFTGLIMASDVPRAVGMHNHGERYLARLIEHENSHAVTAEAKTH
jgi:hypothetical protein